MRIVPRPVFKPMHCAAIPHVGQTDEGVRWIDTGAELQGFDNHVYLSSKAIDEAAKLLSMPTQREFDVLADERDLLQAERDELAAENKRLRAYESAYLAAFAAEPSEPEPAAA